MLGRGKNDVNKSAFAHTLIAEGTVVTGDIAFNGSLHVQGKVIGNIRAEGDKGQLIVGETGSIEGEVQAPNIVINGHVDGNVHSSEHLELAEKAEIAGNVFYNVIEMLMGAHVNGKLVRQDKPRHLPSPNQFDEADDDEDNETVDLGNL